MEPVSTASPATVAGTNSLAPKSKAEEQKNQFMQLLVAQLKGQDPLDPKDGSEFIAQLAQFSSLEELVNIRTALENIQKTSEAAMTQAAANPFQGAQ
jgi:flagellar basal-body rod modification protein FlgD